MSQPLEVVENALAAMLERRRDQIIKNPAGFLVKAIKNQWKPREKKPTQAAATERSKLPDGFLEWYQWAIAHGIVEDVPVSWLPLYQNHEPMVRVSQPSIGGQGKRISNPIDNKVFQLHYDERNKRLKSSTYNCYPSLLGLIFDDYFA